jgi:hypothetical protein
MENSTTGGGSVVSGGGSSLVLLEQHTASNSVSLDFTSFISSAYDEYAIEVLSIRPDTNDVNLFIQMSTDGGATWDTASNYTNKLLLYGAGVTGYADTLTGIVLNYPPQAIRDTAPVGVKASLHLFLAQQTADVVTVIGDGIASAQDNNNMWFNLASYYNIAGASVNALRFIFSKGNIASGIIRIYGIARINQTGGGNGGLVLLEQHTASNSASLDFTTAFTSTYDDYVMELVGIIPTTDGAVPYLRCSNDGGSTWDTSSVYTGNEMHAGPSGSDSFSYVEQGQWIFFSDNGGSALSSSALPALVGSIHIYDPLSTSKHKRFVFDGIGVYSVNGADYVVHSSGKYAKTTGVNALRFVMSSGNIASGTIRVYGLAK